jgi:hypothetical protein
MSSAREDQTEISVLCTKRGRKHTRRRGEMDPRHLPQAAAMHLVDQLA